MKKAVIALSLVALFSSCQKKEFTCECVDMNDELISKRTTGDLNYSDFSTYCGEIEYQSKQLYNGLKCSVREATKEEVEESK